MSNSAGFIVLIVIIAGCGSSTNNQSNTTKIQQIDLSQAEELARAAEEEKANEQTQREREDRDRNELAQQMIKLARQEERKRQMVLSDKLLKEQEVAAHAAWLRKQDAEKKRIQEIAALEKQRQSEDAKRLEEINAIIQNSIIEAEKGQKEANELLKRYGK